MERSFRHMAAAILLAVVLCSCGREGRVIPRKKMAEIYAEMYLVDSWFVTASPDARMRSDSTAIYLPVLEKYGYSLEDYWASVTHYLKDPERFARILKRSGMLLESDLKAIQSELEEDAMVAEPAIDGDEAIEPPRHRTRPSRRRNKASEENVQSHEEVQE